MVNQEHFLTILHVHSTESGTIAEALQSFLQQKQLDLRKLIGQDMMVLLHLLGNGVNQRIQTSSAHAIHPLFFSQVTAHINSGSCISEGDKEVFFGTMTHFNSGSYTCERDKVVFWNHDQRWK